MFRTLLWLDWDLILARGIGALRSVLELEPRLVGVDKWNIYSTQKVDR
jgi:hypothetical protein